MRLYSVFNTLTAKGLTLHCSQKDQLCAFNGVFLKYNKAKKMKFNGGINENINPKIAPATPLFSFLSPKKNPIIELTIA
ncbi:hypothetical protein [Vibrio parahaemolyticus]|uniref:hypothetical protein n=1 Tax=Vibrio parahaemolyticus TaxID=670 RepID=UPI0012AAD9E1|nr:hypothetical protein [Vibrio parahaemolyticus]EGQ7779477.1 hypothetical protein [Vibrio parahaemolyticus]EII3017613.1 hypothetical protein [Vibrio parahaemolyticus]EII5694242.1 hypothetical protein [Vibrio parahaemolyticus]ELA6102021.1 hypothetical protein [Vibrio parahaemolyticus]ELF4814332.1 hypothetical protein [Vibrio parahaemolyticus]